MREIILDTETTGLNANEERLIEIGCVEMVNRTPTGRTYHVYINPQKEISPGAMAVHGITNEFVADKPKFSEIVDEFLEFIEGSKLVIHNAPFDMGFINAELKRLSRPIIPMDNVVDTLLLARRKHPGAGNKLDDLCNRYGIDNKHRTKHGALLDAEILSHVYIELMGGKQVTMDLGSQNSLQVNGASVSKTIFGQAKQRPVPLSPRIAANEADAHVELVAKLGEKAIWAKYNT